MNEMIILKNVTKKFKSKEREFQALKSINLSLKKGEIVAIQGKSGSGKSTLLNIINGIDYPTIGTVYVNGNKINSLNESQLASFRGKNIGIVFQFFQLIPTLSILENIILAMDFVNAIPKAQRPKRAIHLLDQVDIVRHAHKMPSALSGGEQQRAAIARAMANDPEIFVADEPTGNLDSETAQKIFQLIQKLSNLGKTVIIVTHEKEPYLTYDRIITLKDGQIVTSNQIRKMEVC